MAACFIGTKRTKGMVGGFAAPAEFAHGRPLVKR